MSGRLWSGGGGSSEEDELARASPNEEDARSEVVSVKPLFRRVKAKLLPFPSSMTFLDGGTTADRALVAGSGRFSGDTVRLRFVGLFVGRRLSREGRCEEIGRKWDGPA